MKDPRCRPLIEETVARAERLWLFLDYDGTLAEFASTPREIEPSPDVVRLLTELAQHPRIRVAVVSGRRLGDVEALVPVPNILLAGTYGLELRTSEGECMNRMNYNVIRSTLDALKPRWRWLVDGRQGFYLEDKGWTLAIHARFADDSDAEMVLSAARREAREIASSPGFHLVGGDRFLEIAPVLACKGKAVEYILARCPRCGALPIYIGDDDKDEAAFGVVKAHGGLAVLVSKRLRVTKADYRLESPRLVRHWLRLLIACLR